MIQSDPCTRQQNGRDYEEVDFLPHPFFVREKGPWWQIPSIEKIQYDLVTLHKRSPTLSLRKERNEERNHNLIFFRKGLLLIE